MLFPRTSPLPQISQRRDMFVFLLERRTIAKLADPSKAFHFTFLTQGIRSSTKKSRFGWNFSGWSTLPVVMSMSCGRFGVSYVSEVPHAAQNVRHAFVGVRYRVGLPRVNANDFFSTEIHATACAPAARRQFLQWQFP